MSDQKWDPFKELRAEKQSKDAPPTLKDEDKTVLEKVCQFTNLKTKPCLIGLVTGVALLCIALLYIFTPSKKTDEAGNIPVVEPDSPPQKVKPEGAGETNVPHQEKEIYNRLDPKKKKVEKLLSQPEKPLDPHQQKDFFAEDSKEETSPEAQKGKKKKDFDEVNSLINEMEHADSSKTSTPSKQDDVSEAMRSQKTVKKLPTQTEKTPKTAQTQKGKKQFRIQIASLKSREKAQQQWTHLKRKFPKILNNQPIHIEKVDLGAGKGIYYRVQVGTFTSHAKAMSMRQKLKNKGQDSFVLPVMK